MHRFVPLNALAQHDSPFRRQGGPEFAHLQFWQTLFEPLPTTSFSFKDCNLKFVGANAAMAELCGAVSSASLINKTSKDFFTAEVAARHDALDRQVLTTGKPTRDQLELCVNREGTRSWLLSNRWPAFAEDGRLIGVAGVACILEASRRDAVYQRLMKAIAYLQTNFGSKFDLTQMAKCAGVTQGQLKRDFVNVFGVPPRKFLSRVRLEAAIEKLASARPIGEIALACGYADQSSFTRRFRAELGRSPTEYRTIVQAYPEARAAS